MTSKDLKESMGKPVIARLKQIGKGIRVDTVLGHRILVKTVTALTDMDRVEKEGLLVIPEHAREMNTPPPSTGIVLELGIDLEEHERAILKPGTGVMFSRYAGTDFTIEEEEGFRILEVREVLCTLQVAEDAVVPVS